MSPVFTSMRTTVPRPDAATLTNGKNVEVLVSWSRWCSGSSWWTSANVPCSKSASVV
jgi:hypothetical protein